MLCCDAATKVSFVTVAKVASIISTTRVGSNTVLVLLYTTGDKLYGCITVVAL